MRLWESINFFLCLSRFNWDGCCFQPQDPGSTAFFRLSRGRPLAPGSIWLHRPVSMPFPTFPGADPAPRLLSHWVLLASPTGPRFCLTLRPANHKHLVISWAQATAFTNPTSYQDHLTAAGSVCMVFLTSPCPSQLDCSTDLIQKSASCQGQALWIIRRGGPRPHGLPAF